MPFSLSASKLEYPKHPEASTQALVIHSLDELGGSKIPYMGIVITDGTVTPPPTDTTQTVKAEGYSGSFKQVLQVKNPQETGLLEYVIQQ
ncbi:MAG: hypothetical protein U0519_03630 [Candidatus Gracilibacteria bacterium]